MRIRFVLGVTIAIAAVVCSARDGRAQGIISPFAGAINSSMGGASTAAPIDAIGANYWNPAAISGMAQSEFMVGGQLAYPDITVNSSLRGQSGTTRSDSGLLLVPGLGLVYRSEDAPRITLGTGMYSAGGGVNFPGDPSNPLFAARGPAGNFILGPEYSNMAFLQVVNNASFQATDRLALGVGVIIDYCAIGFNPAVFASPNGTALQSFPSATSARPFWGGGFKAGAYYHITPNLDAGFGYTSPQWLETWFFNSRDDLGNPRQLSLKASLPAIYSWGISYRGIENLTLATDLRFIDYKNAILFGTPLVNRGLGWDNVFAVAVGGQYCFSEKFSARAGYVYNTNPVPTVGTLFNVLAPAIAQHTFSAGVTVRVADNIYSSVSYAYAFQNSLTGVPREVSGTGVIIQSSMQSLLISLTVRFGSPTRCAAAPTAPMAVAGTPTPAGIAPQYAAGATAR